MEPIRANPQGLTGMTSHRGQRKGGNRTGEEVAETGPRHGAAGANMDLGSRSRVTRQQSQRQMVEAGKGRPLPMWAGGPIPEEGIESGAKSGAAQY